MLANLDIVLIGFSQERGRCEKGKILTYLLSLRLFTIILPTINRIQELEDKYERLRNALKNINDVLSEYKIYSDLISESEPAQSK